MAMHLFASPGKKGMVTGVIVFVIAIISKIAVVSVLNPFIEQGEGYQNFNEARQTIRSIGSTVSQIVLSGFV